MTEHFLGKLVLRSFASGLVLMALVSCGGSSEDDAPEGGTCESSQATVANATFDELWTNVFSPQCTACHGVAGDSTTENGPNMQTASAFYDGLVGKKGTDYPEWRTFQVNRPGCVNYQFIQAGSANQSMITAILDESVSLSGCTVAPHRDIPQNVCITSGNLAKMKEWIDSGAAR